MSGRHRAAAFVVAAWLTLTWEPAASAHNGPPYPIVSNQVSGAYRVSLWTDPDATDDGSAGGQFWVILAPAQEGEPVPRDVRARVTIRPLDREGPAVAADAMPDRDDPLRRFAAIVMDHEGPFAVRVEIESAAGQASLDSRVDATYDLRPSGWALAFYALPFLMVGGLWSALLMRRRARRQPR